MLIPLPWWTHYDDIFPKEFSPLSGVHMQVSSANENEWKSQECRREEKTGRNIVKKESIQWKY